MDSIQSVGMDNSAASPRAETNPARLLAHNSGFILMLLAAVHPVLALAMRSSSLLATCHAAMTLAIGVWLALFGKDLRKVAYVAAYIAGAEVLWRMTGAHIFWESGKYFTIFILGLTLLRIKHWQRTQFPILYFLFLCLSIPLTLLALGFSGDARDAISFNLSGPLALMVAVVYFSQMTFDPASMRGLVWWLVIPVLGIAALTLHSTLSAASIRFTDESNFVTSGGFGPNQVSAVLGLAGSLSLLTLLAGHGKAQRLIFLAFGLGLLTLSALTFSRGGIYNAATMLALALPSFLRSPRGRVVGIAVLLIIGLVGGYVIFPRLNAYTGGMLSERFSNLDTTSRVLLARADLAIWSAHPVLGVGPGLAMNDRTDLLGIVDATHTEYTRLLAEHGFAGILALLVMLVMCLRAYLRAPNAEAQTWVAALLAWPLMEMSHAAMRIVAISFLFGLAMVNWAKRDLSVHDSESSQVINL